MDLFFFIFFMSLNGSLVVLEQFFFIYFKLLFLQLLNKCPIK